MTQIYVNSIEEYVQEYKKYQQNIFDCRHNVEDKDDFNTNISNERKLTLKRMEKYFTDYSASKNNKIICFMCISNNSLGRLVYVLKEFILSSFDGNYLYTTNGDKHSLSYIFRLNSIKVINLLDNKIEVLSL